MEASGPPSEVLRVPQPHLAVGLTLGLALLSAGCYPHPQPTTGSLAIPIARLQTTATATLTGVVRAPVGLSGDTRLAAVEEVPLSGATVVLADLAGRPLAEVAPAVTDATGRYRFTAVPVGRTLLVLVALRGPGGASVRLMTLVTTREAELGADVSAGTTVLAAAALARGTVGEVDPVAFLEAASLLDQLLTASDAMRLEDPELLATGAIALDGQSCELRLAVEQVLSVGGATECTPAPTPTPTPRRGSGGGGSRGGAVTPTTGGLTTDITIQDGPILAITPTP